MRIGVLGAGRIGALHAATLHGLPDVTEVVVADADPARAHAVAGDLGCTAAASVGDAIAGELDGAVIAAQTSAHVALIEWCAGAGLPTFCEKPVALDLGEVDRALEHVRRAGIRFEVGYQRRHDPGFRAVRDAIADGTVGRLYAIVMAAHDHEPPPESYIAASGGMFRDMHTHDFDSLRWLSGQEVVEVYATGVVRGSEVFARHGDVDVTVAVLHLGDGALAVVHGTRHDPRGHDVRVEVYGDRDSVVVGLDERTPLRRAEAGSGTAGQASKTWEGFLDRFATAYRNEMAAFADLVAGRAAAPVCTGDDAREALRIAIAAERSRTEGRPVRLEEIS